MVGFLFVGIGIFFIVVLIIIFRGRGQSRNHSSDTITPNAAMSDNNSALDSIVMQGNDTLNSSCEDFTSNDVLDSSSFDSGAGCD